MDNDSPTPAEIEEAAHQVAAVRRLMDNSRAGGLEATRVLRFFTGLSPSTEFKRAMRAALPELN